jgi:hypothetical protein
MLNKDLPTLTSSSPKQIPMAFKLDITTELLIGEEGIRSTELPSFLNALRCSAVTPTSSSTSPTRCLLLLAADCSGDASGMAAISSAKGSLLFSSSSPHSFNAISNSVVSIESA